MAKLSINNLSKSFSNTKILDDINIDVKDGEFIVLVGPSGSGKSTILRIIAGLEQPTLGKIEINDKFVNSLPSNKRDIAMVFQNYALYPHMSVFDNLAFPLKMRKINSEQIKKAVNETSALLNLQNHLNKKPRELSGGERQRVALGRAIIRKPQIFLLDEPLSNLDAKLRVQMRLELLRLHKALLATIVYVTHDQVEALTMGNRIVVLDNGKVQQIDTPENIYKMPQNLFVAGFIGTPQMNFFKLQVIDNTKIDFLGEIINLSKPNNVLNKLLTNNYQNKELVLGIRPEHISMDSTSDLKFDVTVELVEMLGDDFLIYATVKGKKSKADVVIKSSQKCNVKQSNLITISIDLAKAHFFDLNTNCRIHL